MSYLNRLGEKIKLTRKSNGMSQQQLAAKSGFDYRYIGFLEKAKINPTIKTLERIAQALDVNVCEILPSDTEDRERSDIYRLSEREMMMYQVMRNLHKADFKKLKAIDQLIERSIKKQPK